MQNYRWAGMVWLSGKSSWLKNCNGSQGEQNKDFEVGVSVSHHSQLVTNVCFLTRDFAFSTAYLKL